MTQLRTDFPLWDSEEWLGDNYDELHAWLGISRDLYDKVRDFQTLVESGVAAEVLRAEGEALAERLQAESGRVATFEP